MKRHEQTTGVRKWSGDDLLELQGETLTVLDDFLAQYGDVVLNGCTVNDDSIASGLVNIGGKVMPFAGATGITTYPIYLVASVTTKQREYVDGVVRDIAQIYTATTTQTKPTSDYIEIPSDGSFLKFFDNLDSTWLADLKTRLTAVEAYDDTVAATLVTLLASKEDYYERIVDLERAIGEIPTLSTIPTSSTVSYTYEDYVYEFVIGQQCRVYNSTLSRYILYQLYSLIDGVATWQIVKSDCSTTSETVNVNLVSNQSSYDESLLGAIVSVYYGETTLTASWSGSPLVFHIPQEELYEVSSSSLTDYSSSSPLATLLSTGGQERDVFISYSCERVVVSLRSDGDATLTGQSVTIKNALTGVTIGSGTGEQVIVKVPTGTSYTISVSNLDEYTTPDVITYTAMLMERDVEIVYAKIASSSIIFDKSISDPENISGDVNSGYLAILLSRYRRCLCKQSGDAKVSIRYLSDTNSDYYDDGTSAILTGSEGDVMVDFPEFFYKCEIVDNDKVKYTFAESNIDGSYIHVERSLVGAYQAYVLNNMMYSRSGVEPTRSFMQTSGISYAEARGDGYQMIDFQQHCVIAFMLYAKYGTRDLQTILGTGGAESSTYTGTTNSIGNADTVAATSNHVNGLGLEGVFGGCYEWVQGVVINDRVWSITDPDGTVRTRTAASVNGYISNIAAEDSSPFDLVPTAVSGSASTYYADYYTQQSGESLALGRSGGGSTTQCGVALSYCYIGVENLSANFGSRLAFRGEIEEAASVTAFKAITIL